MISRSLVGVVVVWLGIAAIGCASAALAVGQLQRPQPSRPAPVRPAQPTPAPASPNLDLERALIVGNEEQLELWAIDGSAHRILSAGPALHPRRVGPETVVALSAEAGNLQHGAELVQISLHGGARSPLATIAAYSCANETPDSPAPLGLDLQDPSDFLLDPSGTIACLTLMDRNINMADVQVKVRVELATGRVDRWQTVGEPECQPPPGVRTDDPSEGPWCEWPVPPEPESADNFAFDFDEESGWIRERADPPRGHTHLPDFMREQVSPSGRWLVLGGNYQEADYIHRSLVLCDREDGALYPVLAEPSPWPAALKTNGPVVELPDDGLVDVVGESDVRWLRVSESGEVLVVDQLVITPKAASWAFNGELAQ